MKVSEVVAELRGHQPDGQVVIQEIDAVGNALFMVESIVKEEGKIPLLMVRSIERNPYGRLPETFKQTFYTKRTKLKTEIVMSPVDRKWRVIVEDSPVQMLGRFSADVAFRDAIRDGNRTYEAGRGSISYCEQIMRKTRIF